MATRKKEKKAGGHLFSNVALRRHFYRLDLRLYLKRIQVPEKKVSSWQNRSTLTFRHHVSCKSTRKHLFRCRVRSRLLVVEDIPADRQKPHGDDSVDVRRAGLQR